MLPVESFLKALGKTIKMVKYLIYKPYREKPYKLTQIKLKHKHNVPYNSIERKFKLHIKLQIKIILNFQRFFPKKC